MDIEECLERYSTPNTPTNSGQNRPVTPIGQALAPQTTPGKKKAKRKANSPMPAITPIRKVDSPISAITPIKTAQPRARQTKSATGYLGLAKKALQAALEAEKNGLEEEYNEDNEIQLLYNDLLAILDKRPTEAEPCRLENLGLQSQLDQVNAKIDVIAAEIKTYNYRANQAPAIAQTGRAIQQENPKTFAEALKGPQTTYASVSTLMTAQKGPKPQQATPAPPKVTTYRERRLILRGTAQKYPSIDSKGLRDRINRAFKEKNSQLVTPVIGTVTKSLNGGDIILSTTEKYDADFLKMNEEIWKPIFNYNRAHKDTAWHKVVIHGIPTDIFNGEGGMTLLEEEIKVYNGLNPISRPYWLSSSENRAKKQYGSAVVSFETKNEADRALRNRLQIAGISAKTAEYIRAKPRYQGSKGEPKNEPARMERFSHIEVPLPSKTIQ